MFALGAFPGIKPPTAMFSSSPKGLSKGAEQLSGALLVRQPFASLQWLLADPDCMPSIYLHQGQLDDTDDTDISVGLR